MKADAQYGASPGLDDGWLGVIDFLSDWYWEQDENLRFTMMTGRGIRERTSAPSPLIGKLRWEQERIWDINDPSWEEHKAMLHARKPFTDFTYKITARNGELRYLSISGQPFFDKHGHFSGYRGIGRDVTREVRARLRRTIEHAVTQTLATTDSISECAPQIIETICDTLGWTCGAYWEYKQKDNALECIECWSNGAPGAEDFIQSRKVCALVSQTDANLACAAWLKGETIWIPDLAEQNREAGQQFPTSGNLHSAFALPVKADGKVISVLEFYSDHIHQPDTELLECSAFIANQIAQFSQLIRAREALRQSEERFRSLIELSSDWVWEQDEQFRFTFFEGNKGMQERLGISPTSRIGLRRWDIPALNLNEDDWERHHAQLARHEVFNDFIIRRTDELGRERWMAISGKPVFDSNGQFKGYRGIAKDITERKNSEQHIQYLATHDALTGLPNRPMFSELLNQAIHAAKRYERKFAVLFIDLDRFKLINDSLGHDAGDMLLKTAATRLQRCIRASDVVARLGGDEFVVLAQGIEHEKDVERVADKILKTLFKPVALLGQECRVTGSIGICMYPAHARDEQSLMKFADAAMYQAKEAGKNQYRFYSEAAQSKSLERMTMESSLRRAVERKQFFLHFQAKLDLKTRKITGVEALLRWQHPELGLISPTKFIGLAEETGLIIPISRWVLHTACMQNMAWQKAGLPPLCMAVNISARQFEDQHFLDDISSALKVSGMPAHLLELELTESMVILQPERAIGILKELKQLGVRLAIDDFGTGYSSLAQLKNYPIDTLKVDRSFIQDIPNNEDDKTMTRAIISMGKSLGLTVVAEGVETQEQQTFLRENACDETQGFYFSRPVESAGIEALLRSHRA
ncbi:EAL domain-containing protein [Oxalobacteraceae bacterium R-40]|uniref:EAL domain-containing protein n=1 Tax=Keguizhuia sedimenti TaxID=3064264 RepID=A0ABU1BMP1_9BURK|nr:EAL domain-containing protein [Oxalobacteraceae bacterium R-40]